MISSPWLAEMNISLNISSCQACEPGQVVFAERPLLVALPGGILGWDMVGFGSKLSAKLCKTWAIFLFPLSLHTFSLCPMPAVAPKLWECLQKLHEAIVLSVTFFWFRGRFALLSAGATSQPGYHYFPLCGSGLRAHAGAWQVLDLNFNTDCDFRVNINTITKIHVARRLQHPLKGTLVPGNWGHRHHQGQICTWAWWGKMLRLWDLYQWKSDSFRSPTKMCYVSSRCSRSYAYEDSWFYVFDEAVITILCKHVLLLSSVHLFCESPKRLILNVLTYWGGWFRWRVVSACIASEPKRFWLWWVTSTCEAPLRPINLPGATEFATSKQRTSKDSSLLGAPLLRIHPHGLPSSKQWRVTSRQGYNSFGHHKEASDRSDRSGNLDGCDHHDHLKNFQHLSVKALHPKHHVLYAYSTALRPE